MPAKENSNTQTLILSGAVALAIGFFTLKMWARLFGEKKKTTLVDRNTKVSLKLTQKTNVSHDTRLFRFALPTEEHVLGLPVGKHISLSARIDGKLVVRSYTPVSSDRKNGYVDLIIKVYFPNVHPKFPEGGKMTMYLEKMNIGDNIDFVGPKGFIEYCGEGNLRLQMEKKIDAPIEMRFVRKLGMIAGGSGITPMLQIIREIFDREDDSTICHLLYANQTEEDILCKDEIDELVKKSNGQLKVWYTLDRPKENWAGFKGFIDEKMLGEAMPSLGMPTPGTTPTILICGPPPMIKFACIPNLLKLGWEEQDIYTY